MQIFSLASYGSRQIVSFSTKMFLPCYSSPIYTALHVPVSTDPVGEDSVHFKSFTLKWTEWFKIIPSTFEVDRMVLKTIPSTSKVQQASPFST